MRNPALVVLYVVGTICTLFGLMLTIGMQYSFGSAVAELSSAELAPLVGLNMMQMNFPVMVFSGTLLAVGLLSVVLAIAVTAIGRSMRNTARAFE
ncbi:hypothetical protein [Leucobacter sp. G161]|uniref:hypothetical protein n=1 Tax=Leucobacter sp. G161 TaxID=663704 RepID=UPI00073AFC1D|nr:hypothetical protein [Leucobacter sp. G161]KUF05541.1 hypothetical protein AUL38_04085 [Leucobacter sp. G161]